MRARLATMTALAALAGIPCAGRTQSSGPAADSQPDAAASPGVSIAWSGSQRTRYSALHNQFRPALTGDDEALSLQTLIDATAVVGRLRLTGEAQDARAYLTDANSAVSPIIVNTVSLLQAYAGIDFSTPRGELGLTLGRFTMDLGSRRFVARQTFRNTITNFTGARVDWSAPSGGTLTAIAVMPVLVRPNDRQSLLDNRHGRDYQSRDLQLKGLVWQKPLPAGIRGEAFVFDLDERDDPGERETADRNLTTIGFRLRRAPAARRWDFELEVVRQGGRRNATASPADTAPVDVTARYVHTGIGYTFAGPLRLRLGVEHDAASGNRGGDGWQRFDSLFGPRRADLGPTGIYGPLGRENLRSGGLRVTIAPNDRFDAFVAWRRNRLDEPGDTFARTGVRDPAGASGRDAGTQLELRARYWIVPARLRAEFGAAYFKTGHFLEQAPNATPEGDTTFWYSDLTYRFGRSPR